MKKTFITVIEMFLLVCSSSFSQQIVETKYFSNHNELGGDVIILKQFQRVEGTKSITSFEIKSPRYEKLGNGDDISATKLIGDLTFREYPSVMHKIRERVAYKPNIDGKINTIRPLHSNYMAYVKELLALERPDTKKTRIM